MLSAQSDQQQLNLLLDQKKKKKKAYLVFRPFPLFSSFLSRGDPVSPDTTGGSAIAHLKKHLGSHEIWNTGLWTVPVPYILEHIFPCEDVQ